MNRYTKLIEDISTGIEYLLRKIGNLAWQGTEQTTPKGLLDRSIDRWFLIENKKTNVTIYMWYGTKLGRASFNQPSLSTSIANMLTHQIVISFDFLKDGRLIYYVQASSSSCATKQDKTISFTSLKEIRHFIEELLENE